MEAVLEQTRATPLADAVFGKDEARQLLEATAQRYLHISGEEFLRRWDAGEYQNPDNGSGVMRVAMLIPMVRETSARG